MGKCNVCGVDEAALREEIEILEGLLDEATSSARLSNAPVHTDAEDYYVGSKNRQTFHRPECDWAGYIRNSNTRIEFSDHGEAVDAGYKPCKTCCA